MTPPAVRPNMGEGDLRDGRIGQAQMRSANLGLLLRHLREHGGRTRAQLAAETGLSKGTTSTLVGDLVERGLVREDGPTRDGTVGRPGLVVHLDGRGVVGMGLEITEDHITLVATDLAGTALRESVTPLDVRHQPIETVLDRVAGTLDRSIESLRAQGMHVVGLTVSPPGVIDYDSGTVRFAPNLGWRDLPLAAHLVARLPATQPPLHLENDAKAAAVAEFAGRSRDGIRDLVFLTGNTGVGAGIIAGGQLSRGWAGFSGEVGHLPLDPSCRTCNCGRTACWELCVGVNELFRLVVGADDSGGDTGPSIDARLSTIHARAARGDQHTLAALAEIADNLAIGMSVIVDVLNPRLIVLGGYFARFSEFLLDPVLRTLRTREMAAGSRVELAASQLGLMATARGGALLALESVFADPGLVGPPA